MVRRNIYSNRDRSIERVGIGISRSLDTACDATGRVRGSAER